MQSASLVEHAITVRDRRAAEWASMHYEDVLTFLLSSMDSSLEGAYNARGQTKLEG
jgi:hypothetical protein